jgi:hypothetical protein
MNRRTILNLSAIAAVGLATPLSTAVGQQKSIKEQIIGTWTFVSALDVRPELLEPTLAACGIAKIAKPTGSKL